MKKSSSGSLPKISPKTHIIIQGARVNNLKHINIALPRNKLVVITGLSGSGKSSLAFDTLFAEGQRMYVESLGSYARQFIGRMEKPDVDYIQGISPAIAIEQKINTRNTRSTVGTTTEIYDYLKLLFSRIGKTYSPISGQEVKRNTVSSVVDHLLKKPNTRILITTPLKKGTQKEWKKDLPLLLSKGFSRIVHKNSGEIMFIEDVIKQNLSSQKSKTPYHHSDWNLLIDRAVYNDHKDLTFQLSDSVRTAFYEGHGECITLISDHQTPKWESHHFSDRFERDGITFTEPSLHFFSFNNPYGACRTCEGFGSILDIDEDLVFPNKRLSVYEGAIAPWRGDVMHKWLRPLLLKGSLFDFPIHTPFKDLTLDQRRLLWTGNSFFDGLDKFFRVLKNKTHKIQYRVMLSRFRGRTTCPDCRGTKLRKDASYVKINGMSIIDLILMPIDEVYTFFQHLRLSSHETFVAHRILSEINTRLQFMMRVDLGYLTLNRSTPTLSGGEFQRIKLATSLGSALVGAMYILDEPSIGLHPRNTTQLIEALVFLRNLGNTVIIVEHEEEIMRSADYLIDMGPDAGTHGGQIVFHGDPRNLPKKSSSHTLNFLTKKEEISIPIKRRPWTQHISIQGACENNLKDITTAIPLGVFTVVTGVSGSGKSTLIQKILYPAMTKFLGLVTDRIGKHESLSGDLSVVTQVEQINQTAIGKSSRSNPISYVKGYDAIRQLFAAQPLAKRRGYTASHFSFNMEGGRCETCQGEGRIKVEMQFMADIYLTCESCHGTRFKSDICEVEYNGKNISDVLEMTVEEAHPFFVKQPGLHEKINSLLDVGLGYIRLGQSSSSLSGGEAQRVKLASFIGKKYTKKKEHFLFIFDEPSTGLHFHDILQLLKALNTLIDEGHSVVVIEHNMDIIKCADWIIDLGPEGGDKNGGHIVFAGTPEDLIKKKSGHTSRYLSTKFNK